MKLFYITSNLMWSGSEELWSRSMLRFKSEGKDVLFTAVFNHHQLDDLRCRRVPFFRDPLPLLARALIKFRLLPVFDPVRKLVRQLKQERPDLVVISQGNTLESADIMTACLQANANFVVISQLVAEFIFLAIDHSNLFRMRNGYPRALRNYFVSHSNCRLHMRMIGIDLNNAEVIFNPCKVKEGKIAVYPENDSHYTIGMVGRLECFHKGFDLMLEVMALDHWKNRPVSVNIYGKGEHEGLIKFNIERLGITNVFIKSYVANVAGIWAENQILLMPSRIEGQALSLIEAVWCERAAIVTDAGGATELIEDGISGFIAEAPSISALDKAMERAWEKRHQWMQMGKAAKERLKTCHPADEVAYFNNSISNLLKGV